MAPPPQRTNIKRRRRRHPWKAAGSCLLLMAIALCFLNFFIGVKHEVQRPPIPGIVQHHPRAIDKKPGVPKMIPSLDSLLNTTTGQVIGDPQSLLDFAIIGHGKCGTTSLQHWLSQHSEIHCPMEEILELSLGTAKDFISRLIQEASISSFNNNINNKNNNNILLGIKNPGEIRIPDSIRFFQTYFPQTKLIVGIRHPVRWFESLYNFKVQNLRIEFSANHWGDPNTLIGACPPQEPRIFHCVGTHKGLFHVHLAYLGKTMNVSKAMKRDYNVLRRNNTIIPTPNPVFLFDVDQLSDDNNKDLKQDLKDFLGLHHDLGPMPRRIPGKQWPPNIQAERDQYKINICDDQYLPVRTELMKISRQTSEFIRYSGFLDHPDVHVSSKDYFVKEIMGQRWMKDPCT